MTRKSGASLLFVCFFGSWASVSASDLTDLVAGPVEKVAGDCKFTEGPAWHPDGYLLFTDVPNERILKRSSGGEITEWFKPSDRANGLMCDREGNVYACQGGAHQVVRLRSDANGLGQVQQVLASEYEAKPFNQPNDLAIDADGGLYFTDPYYGPPQELPQPMQAVYYIARDGQVTRVIDDLPSANGVVMSRDNTSLYVANIERAQVLRYSIEGPGKLAKPEMLFEGDKALDGRGPDGMTVDEHGNIYATYKTVVVIDPAGQLIGRVAVPEKPANCAFGGDDNRTLFITAVTSLYAVPMKVAGVALPAPGPGGAVATRTVRARDLTLDVPREWTQEEPSIRLRLAQFKVPAATEGVRPAEFVVSGPFGGTDAANVELWLQQFLPQDRTMKAVQGHGRQGDYVLIDLAGTFQKPVGLPIEGRTEPEAGWRMLGVILKLQAGGNYFLKLTGPAETVTAAATQFRQAFGGDEEHESDYQVSDG